MVRIYLFASVVVGCTMDLFILAFIKFLSLTVQIFSFHLLFSFSGFLDGDGRLGGGGIF